jgi:hypothetical protein
LSKLKLVLIDAPVCALLLCVGAPLPINAMPARTVASGAAACENCGRQLSKVKHHRPYGVGRAWKKHSIAEGLVLSLIHCCVQLFVSHLVASSCRQQGGEGSCLIDFPLMHFSHVHVVLSSFLFAQDECHSNAFPSSRSTLAE